MSTATITRTEHVDPTSQSDACPICGYWRCRCNEHLGQSVATLAEPTSGPLFTTLDDPGQADEAVRRAREADKQRQVAEVADYFRAVNPNGPITDAGRFTTAVMVAGTVGRVRPLLRALPHVDTMPAGTTRRAYADQLTTPAGACG